MRGSSAFSVCILFEENVFIFQVLNDKIHSYVVFDIIVHFIIQKLKNKHTFLKNIQTEKAEEPLILTEREETQTRYFAPSIHDHLQHSFSLLDVVPSSPRRSK